MKSKNNSMVLEMIEQLDVDDDMRNVMRRFFDIEARSSRSTPSKNKVNNCREILEKATK